jgi:hypothetical protein
MLFTMVLGTATFFGHAAAGPGEDYGAREVGTVRFIDRQLNLIQLDDGTELHTTDARMLQNIREGMLVQVDFAHGGSTNELNSIEPVGADTQVDVTPATND